MDLHKYCAAELETRRQLHLPPFTVLALFGGAGGVSLASQITGTHGLDAWADGDEMVVRFNDTTQLVAVMSGASDLEGVDRRTVRVHVDPPRV